MIINKIAKGYQMRSDKPNSNWLDDDYFVIDDNSKLAEKIISLYPHYDLVVANNEIIDVVDNLRERNIIAIKKQKIIEIEELKKMLSDTDYQAIKYAEGQLSEEEYAPMKQKRQAYRDRINELESEV